MNPSQLPERERLAFVGAVTALARVDGAVSMSETLAVLEEIELEGLSEEGVAVACAAVLDPPSFDRSVEALRALPAGMLTEVMARLVLVARADGELQAAESAALRRAEELLGLGERRTKRARRRVERERWRREHGLEQAHDADGWRNLLVAVAGFGAPLVAVARLGLEHASSPALALRVGLDRLAGGHGVVAGMVVAMAISFVAAALTSAITLRGRRVDRLEREVAARSHRVRRNLRALVEHVSGRMAHLRQANGPRVVYKTLEGRLQAFQTALLRHRSDG